MVFKVKSVIWIATTIIQTQVWRFAWINSIVAIKTNKIGVATFEICWANCCFSKEKVLISGWH